MTIDAGNTIRTATALKVTPNPLTVRDWVGSAGGALDRDYYRFSLTERSSFNLTLDGLSADADVRLIRDANNNGRVDSSEVTASSIRSGNLSESISFTLDAGTYFIQVFPYTSTQNTYYNLRVSADPIIGVPIDSAGNSLSGARDITVDSTFRTYSDWVGPQDTNDYYRFSVANSRDFNMVLHNVTQNLGFQLISDRNTNGIVDNGEVLGVGVRDADTIEFPGADLTAGTYYVRVFSSGTNASSYDLSLFATPFGSPAP
ncbi:hypothetical protein WA1_49265 [Scytonema hofmannii PCC 7110]|uniref:Peptidase C-terminal archaeal/bacterial domain-containing protein n=1 Tax=Scytonema hofmannii PCC 7110 TaxID=128403 RepID=A0A139WQN1_9CYAN|nr:PPC domain-containing protein [Scytonema hofmannii]KYC34731.1 hypothetical protein WA1_49265 [Scytonema hofmannii PCC 7110]